MTTQMISSLTAEDKAQILIVAETVLGANPDEIEFEMHLPNSVQLNINGTDLNAGGSDDDDENDDDSDDEDEDDDGLESELSIHVAYVATVSSFANARVLFDFDSLEELRDWANT